MHISFGKWMRILFILFVVFVGYSGLQIILYSFHDETREADSAIVLGATAWGDRLSPVFRERINHGIHLYHEGIVDTLIFTGGKRSEEDLAESEVAKRYAIKRGVADEDILIETRSSITEENLEYALQVSRKKQLTSFLIVSDPLHMKRAVTMARDMGMEAYSSPTPTSAYKSYKTKLPFFIRELFFYLGYQATRVFR